MHRFEIRRSRFGRRRWRVRLVASNGEVLSVSEHLNSLAAAEENIAAQRVAARSAEVRRG